MLFITRINRRLKAATNRDSVSPPKNETKFKMYARSELIWCATSPPLLDDEKENEVENEVGNEVRMTGRLEREIRKAQRP